MRICGYLLGISLLLSNNAYAWPPFDDPCKGKGEIGRGVCVEAKDFEASFLSEKPAAKDPKDERLAYRVCNLSDNPLYFVWRGAGFWSEALHTPKAGGCVSYSRPAIGGVGNPEAKEILITRGLIPRQISTLVDKGTWVSQTFDFITSVGFPLPQAVPSAPTGRTTVQATRRKAGDAVQFEVSFPSGMITCIGLPRVSPTTDESILRELKDQGLVGARILSNQAEASKACLNGVRGSNDEATIAKEFKDYRVLLLATPSRKTASVTAKFSIPSKDDNIRNLPAVVFSLDAKDIWFVFAFPAVASGE